MSGMQIVTVDRSSDLFDTCKQSVVAKSDCYAAVVFLSFNETNVEYSIAVDEWLSDGYWWGNWKDNDDILSNLLLPLQWAVDAQIGGFPNSPRPSTQVFKGQFGPNYVPWPESVNLSVQGGSVFWISTVALFVGPVFIIILIGVVYHLAVLVATVCSPDVPHPLATY